jgi:uncharacterized membrane protein YeiH
MLIEETLYAFDLAGVVVFAISGALAAARKNMDLFGFIIIATVTAIGGGTMRDLLLGDGAVFWIFNPTYILVCTGTAIISFFIAPHLQSRLRVLLWADAVGLAVFAVIGVEKALALGVNGLSAVLMGMITGAFGGVIRDVLCNEIPLLLQKDIYALAALVGASAHVGLDMLGVDDHASLLISIVLTFSVRAIAMTKGYSLPSYGAKK